MIVAALAEAGYAVAVARNGAEGLERCRQFAPDVVVLDLLMPEVDGVEFLKRRPIEGGCDAPVIVMSAGYHRRNLPVDAPVAALIEKPFAIEQFLDTIAAQTPEGDAGARRRRMSHN
jgi:two-component system OmpR family response regulator